MLSEPTYKNRLECSGARVETKDNEPHLKWAQEKDNIWAATHHSWQGQKEKDLWNPDSCIIIRLYFQKMNIAAVSADKGRWDTEQRCISEHAPTSLCTACSVPNSWLCTLVHTSGLVPQPLWAEHRGRKRRITDNREGFASFSFLSISHSFLHFIHPPPLSTLLWSVNVCVSISPALKTRRFE